MSSNTRNEIEVHPVDLCECLIRGLANAARLAKDDVCIGALQSAQRSNRRWNNDNNGRFAVDNYRSQLRIILLHAALAISSAHNDLQSIIDNSAQVWVDNDGGPEDAHRDI